MKHKWYQGKIIEGEKRGKKLGFPTLNLDNPQLLNGYKEGVYACQVRIGEKLYGGMLFFGPRLILGETANVLEIFVFGFNQKIYGKTIFFQVFNYIRKVKNFSDEISLREQLKRDEQCVRKILTYSSKK